MSETNAEVLRTIEATCLSPASRRAHRRRRAPDAGAPPESVAAREAALTAELAALEGEIGRYVAAVAKAPDLTAVLEALRARERHRTTLRTQLEGLRQRRTSPVDARGLEQRVRQVVAERRGVLGRQVGESRRLLKGFLEGRIVFTSVEDGPVEFVRRGRMGLLLAGAIRTTIGGVPEGIRAM